MIAGDPERNRDFVYVDDGLAAIERLVAEGRWNETVLIASGRSTSLRTAAELVRDEAGSSSPIETPGGELPAGENESYRAAPEAPLPLNLSLEEGIRRYVDWLKKHPAAEIRARKRSSNGAGAERKVRIGGTVRDRTTGRSARFVRQICKCVVCLSANSSRISKLQTFESIPI